MRIVLSSAGASCEAPLVRNGLFMPDRKMGRQLPHTDTENIRLSERYGCYFVHTTRVRSVVK